MASSMQRLQIFSTSQCHQTSDSLSLHQRRFSFFFPSKHLVFSLIASLLAFFQFSLPRLFKDAFVGRGTMETLSFRPHSPSSSPLPLPLPLFIFLLSRYCWSQQSANTQLMDLLATSTSNQRPLFSLHFCCFSTFPSPSLLPPWFWFLLIKLHIWSSQQTSSLYPSTLQFSNHMYNIFSNLYLSRDCLLNAHEFLPVATEG